MIEKPLRDITEEDLLRLVDTQVSEGKTIDFKLTLPGGTRDERRDFLADASAFANTLGGDLVYGIRDDDSVAAEVVGFEVDSLDTAQLRLSQMLNDSIEPRIEFDLHHVALANGRHALVLRVEQGWNGPYRVLAGDYRFYVRDDKGKRSLDILELRGAFLRSQVTSERMEAFHVARLVDVAAGRVPIEMAGDARLVLHLLPMSAFLSPQEIDRRELYGPSEGLQPLGHDGWRNRITAEGLLVFTPHASSYTHAHRSGIVEAVDGSVLNREIDGQQFIPAQMIEVGLVAGVRRYLGRLEGFGIRLPVIAHVALVNAQGRILWTDRWSAGFGERVALDRQVLRLPAITFAEYDAAAVPHILKPAFDVLWNAFGYEGSQHYAADGSWQLE